MQPNYAKALVKRGEV